MDLVHFLDLETSNTATKNGIPRCQCIGDKAKVKIVCVVEAFAKVPSAFQERMGKKVSKEKLFYIVSFYVKLQQEKLLGFFFLP